MLSSCSAGGLSNVDGAHQGRRDCNFTITTGPTCLTGWCNGGLLCDPHTGTVRVEHISKYHVNLLSLGCTSCNRRGMDSTGRRESRFLRWFVELLNGCRYRFTLTYLLSVSGRRIRSTCKHHEQCGLSRSQLSSGFRT